MKDNKMTLQPVHSRILVKEDTPESTTKFGIILPEVAQEQLHMGVVVAIGDSEVVHPDIQVGVKIMWGKFSGGRCVLNGEEHVLVQNEDVYGIIQEDQDNA